MHISIIQNLVNILIGGDLEKSLNSIILKQKKQNRQTNMIISYETEKLAEKLSAGIRICCDNKEQYNNLQPNSERAKP